MNEIPLKKDLTILENLKEYRYQQINNRTDEIISEGFIYDGVLFSLSDNAQKNWLNKFTARSFISYPHNISCKVDSLEYSLETQAELETWYLTGATYIDGIVSTGRALRISIGAATTIEEINTIIDNR